jgi:hypothetical protein
MIKNGISTERLKASLSLRANLEETAVNDQNPPKR